MQPNSETTHIDVQYVADLARIALGDDEAQRYQAELDAVLDYVRKLDELDVDGIEPTAHATPLTNVMREDTPGATIDRDWVLRNAPAVADESCLRVPVVIEDEEDAG